MSCFGEIVRPYSQWSCYDDNLSSGFTIPETMAPHRMSSALSMTTMTTFHWAHFGIVRAFRVTSYRAYPRVSCTWNKPCSVLIVRFTSPEPIHVGDLRLFAPFPGSPGILSIFIEVIRCGILVSNSCKAPSTLMGCRQRRIIVESGTRQMT